MSELTKVKPSSDKPESKNGRDQKFDFWFDPNYWQNLSKYRKTKKITSKELVEELGEIGAREAILDSVRRGEPPIDNIPEVGVIQLRLSY